MQTWSSLVDKNETKVLIKADVKPTLAMGSLGAN